MNYFPNPGDNDHESDPRHRSADNPRIPNLTGAWDALGISVPTISAYAYLCAHTLFDRTSMPASVVLESLTGPAKTVLFLAKETGAIELKVTPRAFRPSERFLALYIHVTEDESIVFQDPSDLRVAIEFLGAFRELCVTGLCIHQLHGEFSLNQKGFELANTIRQQEVEPWLTKAQNSSTM